MIEVNVVKIQHDYETSERADAGGMFQVIACKGILDNESAFDIDQRLHYCYDEDALSTLQGEYPNFDFSNVEIENDYLTRFF